jgi:hypothetical protein
MNALTNTFESDLDRLMQIYGAKTREDLRQKLGLSKNTIRNWERAGSVPDQYRRRFTGPWQVIAALSVLRDDQLTDAEARKAALTFLQQLEVAHG